MCHTQTAPIFSCDIYKIKGFVLSWLLMNKIKVKYYSV